MCDYDITQAIGKRYRRQDEIGTPYCVTIDFDSLEDDAVTVRERLHGTRTCRHRRACVIPHRTVSPVINRR